VSGGALSAITSNPLMAAEIAEGASLNQATITTGEDGRFSFKNLAPGSYTVRAKRDGYFGSTTPGSPPTSPLATTALTIVAAQSTPNVSLPLAQGGAIAGRVLGPNGQPMTNTAVNLYRKGYNDGREALTASQSKNTDDSGDYRFYWLAPGDYYVGVTPPRPSVTDGRPQTYAKTFYPSTTNARGAERMVLKDGTDLKGININVPVLNSVKVSGQLVNTISGTASTTGPVSLFFTLMNRDTSLLTDMTLQVSNDSPSRDGHFELRGIPTGSYDIVATAPDAQGRAFPGRARIDVGSEDLQNVTITVHPGVEVRTRVTLDEKPIAAQPVIAQPGIPNITFDASGGRTVGILLSTSAPALTDRGSGNPAIRIQLRSKENYAAPFDSAAAMNVSSDANGAVVFPNVPESVYSVLVSGTVPATVYLSDIREGGVSIYDNGLTVGAQSPGTVDVILKSGGSTITGTVRDAANKPVVNGNVVMVPPQSQRRNPFRYKNVRTGLDGSFTISAVPPGDYTLFAWQDVFSIPTTAYMNAEFLSKYESRGKTVSAAAGVSPSAQLTVLPPD